MDKKSSKRKARKKNKKVKVFDFEEQKKKGLVGEDAFKRFYADLNPIKSLDDNKFDFTLKDGKTVELKSDYKDEPIENFFMEYYSNKEEKKMGGVFKSLENNVDWFCYLFIKEMTFYWFKPKELVEWLEVYIKDLAYKNVRNAVWTTTGYCIKREDMMKYCKREDAA